MAGRMALVVILALSASFSFAYNAPRVTEQIVSELSEATYKIIVRINAEGEFVDLSNNALISSKQGYWQSVGFVYFLGM